MVIQVHSMNGTNYGAAVADVMARHVTVQEPSRPAAVPAGNSGAPEQATTEQVKRAAEMINKTIQSFSRGLEFSVDEETDKTVVRVVDTQTNEVIRQMPSEEVLAIAKALDKLQGMLLRLKA
ncbi:MAG: flagellar protein FlaG [Pseudomonadota bacterium]